MSYSVYFTQTVGSMTDAVRSTSATTQTAEPRIGLDFGQLFDDGEDGDDRPSSPPFAASTLAVWDNLMDAFDERPTTDVDAIERSRTRDIRER